MAADPTLHRFYFTFGFGQPHAGRFVVIDALGWGEARDEMVRRFGRVWGFQYDAEEWVRDGVSQADEYGLTEIH